MVIDFASISEDHVVVAGVEAKNRRVESAQMGRLSVVRESSHRMIAPHDGSEVLRQQGERRYNTLPSS